MKKILLKDIIIPAGTVFECCDGHHRQFISGNYETTIGLSKDTAGSLIYGVDELDPDIAGWFADAPLIRAEALASV